MSQMNGFQFITNERLSFFSVGLVSAVIVVVVIVVVVVMIVMVVIVDGTYAVVWVT
jgi:hypothetical protein